MLLDKSDRSVIVQLLAAKTTLDCMWSGSYFDTKKEAEFPGASVAGLTNGVTPVTLIPVPSDNMARAIKEIFVYNNDSANVTVIISYKFTATSYIVKKSLLTPGQTLTYQDDYGWIVS